MTVLKLTGEAIGHRPLLTLGVLLVVVGMQFFSLGLISELLTSQHEQRGTSAPRARARSRTSTRSSPEGPLLRDVRARLPAQRAGDRVPAPRRRRGGRAPRAGVGGTRDTTGAPASAAARGRARGGAPPRGGRASATTPWSSAIRATSTWPPRGARPAARRSSSTRSSRSGTRSWTTGAASGPARSRRARSRASTGTRSARPTSSSPTPRRTPTSSPRSGASRASASPCASSAPRSGCSARPWEPSERALFVGKLIPLHGLETILAAARLAPELPLRVVGSGQLERVLAGRPPNVEWIPWIPYEQLAGELRAAACALGVFGTSAKAGA